MSKLMIITRYFPPVHNGLSDHTWLLLNCIKNDFDSILVLHERSDLDEPHEISAHIDQKIRYVTFNTIEDVRSAALAAIKSFRPDAVMLQYVPHMWGRAGIAPQIVMLAWQVRTLFQVPLVTFVHELYYDWGLSMKQNVISLIHRLQLFMIGHSSMSLIVTNEYRRKLLSRVFRHQQVRRTVAGNVSGRKPELSRQVILPWPYILWYGTFSDGQRLEELVGAFVAIAAEFPVLRLVLVGAFDVTEVRVEHLKQICKDEEILSRIAFWGFAEDDKLSDLMSGSLLNLHINQSGPSGRRTVLAAYLRSGRPIVSISGPETDPEFKHMDNIVLVQDANERALVAAIKTVILDEDLQNHLSRGARILYKQQYSDMSVRHAILESLNEILSPGLISRGDVSCRG